MSDTSTRGAGGGTSGSERKPVSEMTETELANLALRGGLTPEERERLDSFKFVVVPQPSVFRDTDGKPTTFGYVAVTVGIVLALAAAAYIGSVRSEAGTPNIRPEFVRWEPIDASRGYAYISLVNEGSSAGTAKCVVEVKSDFGDIGFDILVGIDLAPGERWDGRVPLTVSGDGAFLVTLGSVRDC